MSDEGAVIPPVDYLTGPHVYFSLRFPYRRKKSCPILCDPMDYTVHGILQARILEWVAFPFSRGLPNSGIKPRSPTLQRILCQLSHKGDSPVSNDKSKSSHEFDAPSFRENVSWIGGVQWPHKQWSTLPQRFWA